MKRLLGVLGGMALAASAHADGSSVTVSGTIDSFVGSMRNAGDTRSTREVGSGGMTTSYFGFAGVEDLGGGLSAYFNLNAFFQPSSGTIGRFTGDSFFARDANVGISGRFGVIQLGRGLAPNFLPSVFANPFGDSFTFSPLILHENVTTNGWQSLTVPSDTGWSNEVIYTTPNLAGLTASVNYQFGEQADNGKKNVGASVIYAKGPWLLTGFYEHAQVTNPSPSLITVNVNGVTVPATSKDWMIGGSYNAGFVKGYASYGHSTTDENNFEAKTSQVGFTIPIGINYILADWAHTSASGPFNGTRNTESVGYDYFLSKRTDLYAVVMHDAVTSEKNGNSAGVGIRARF